jgi:hypothetical protein
VPDLADTVGVGMDGGPWTRHWVVTGCHLMGIVLHHAVLMIGSIWFAGTHDLKICRSETGRRVGKLPRNGLFTRILGYVFLTMDVMPTHEALRLGYSVAEIGPSPVELGGKWTC